MAVYNEILSGRFNRGLTKLFSMKGPAPSPQIASELMAILRMPDHDDIEYFFGYDRFGASAAIAGSAATFASAWLRNPAKSNTAVIVDRITAESLTAALVINVFNNTNTGDLGSGFPGIRRLDARTVRSAVAIATFGNPGAQPASSSQIDIASAVQGVSVPLIVHRAQRLILMPNDTLQLSNNTANTAWVVAFQWRERPLEDSELS